jgi:hypothetical protein
LIFQLGLWVGIYRFIYRAESTIWRISSCLASRCCFSSSVDRLIDHIGACIVTGNQRGLPLSLGILSDCTANGIRFFLKYLGEVSNRLPMKMLTQNTYIHILRLYLLEIFKTGVVNPRPKLVLKFSYYSIFWVFLLSFNQNAVQTNLGCPPLV